MSSGCSSDEGEISDSGLEKATKSLPQYDGTSVDRPDRPRSRYSTSKSPSAGISESSRDRRSRDRSHSPYSSRAPRGSKRSRDEDHYDQGHADPRRFKVHYEDRPADRRRAPISYDDIDHKAGARHDDRDRHVEKRHRTRSRSPYRASRDSGNGGRSGYNQNDGSRSRYAGGDQPRHEHKGQNGRSARDRDLSVSKRGTNPMPTDLSKRETKFTQGSSQFERVSGDDKGLIKQSHPKVEDDIPEEKPLDEAAMIEERRKKREAIKAKYRGSATPMLVQALHLGSKISTLPPGKGGEDDTDSVRSGSPASFPGTPQELTHDHQSPGAFAAINTDAELANTHGVIVASIEDGPSAADYDPTMDMREDRTRGDRRHNEEASSASYDETKHLMEQDVLLPAPAAPIAQQPKKAKDDFDMFADEDDDMFAEAPADKPEASESNRADDDKAVAVPIPEARTLDIGMLDNWDDSEGYYKIILGELLNGRYHVQSNLGQGMFSGVVRAMDVATKRLVAIKLIRNNETMRKAGMKEIQILQQLNEADPDDKKHMIRLERHFEHKGHLCMVFENLSINLREVLKKFGRDVGINLKAVRAYAQQSFLGLSLLRKCNILHADLKPDNILVNDGRNILKICDLGSASDASENEITPYLVSRFYRAPEIILGIPYDFAIDIWSIGCTLYELYTGKILFTGRTNNQMLRSIMECRGKFTTKVLKRAQFAHVHFDEMANFLSVEQDKLSGKDTVKTISFAKPVRDLRTKLLSASKGLSEEEMKDLNLFADLLDRCLALNPEKRCTPMEALKHPFISRVAR